MKYKRLVKNQIYTVTNKKRVGRFLYQGRYFNKEVKLWCYIFKHLDGFGHYTPIANEVIVREI